MRMVLPLSAFLAISAGTVAVAQQSSGNASIDPEHIFLTEPVKSPVTAISEPVKGSSLPVQLIYVETVDGLYAPIGLRKPPGNGPFPIIVFAHMNGGLGVQ
jgi:dipeptidyl aminopeptidase/acylaminoacyl peptidase